MSLGFILRLSPNILELKSVALPVLYIQSDRPLVWVSFLGFSGLTGVRAQWPDNKMYQQQSHRDRKKTLRFSSIWNDLHAFWHTATCKSGHNIVNLSGIQHTTFCRFLIFWPLRIKLFHSLGLYFGLQARYTICSDYVIHHLDLRPYVIQI